MAIARDDVSYVRGVCEAIGQSMFGLDEVVRQTLCALYTDGHILLEGNPGLGKTQLVKTLCAALGLSTGRFGRIQFTPDLMPADITGTKMPDPAQSGQFAFQPGPVFRWLLLADEINRATPKTQSAMLEAMAERHVTVLGETHTLTPEQPILFNGDAMTVIPPFMVLATQNPIDQEGTYDLPEAQADRFMMKIRMPFPVADTLTRIVGKDAGQLAQTDAAPVSVVPPPAATDEAEALARYHRIKGAIRNLTPLPSVQHHIINVVLATNNDPDGMIGIDRVGKKRISEWYRRYIQYGLGPRAATALMLGAKAYAGMFISGEGDHMVAGFARVALPVMRHRLKLDLDWQARFLEDRAKMKRARDEDDFADPDDLHDQLMTELLEMTAPNVEGYRDALAVALGDAGAGAAPVAIAKR